MLRFHGAPVFLYIHPTENALKKKEKKKTKVADIKINEASI